jgi:hypothetical protein
LKDQVWLDETNDESRREITGKGYSNACDIVDMTASSFMFLYKVPSFLASSFIPPEPWSTGCPHRRSLAMQVSPPSPHPRRANNTPSRCLFQAHARSAGAVHVRRYLFSARSYLIRSADGSFSFLCHSIGSSSRARNRSDGRWYVWRVRLDRRHARSPLNRYPTSSTDMPFSSLSSECMSSSTLLIEPVNNCINAAPLPSMSRRKTRLGPPNSDDAHDSHSQ